MPADLDTRLRSMTGSDDPPAGFLRAVRVRRTARRARAIVTGALVLAAAAGVWFSLPGRTPHGARPQIVDRGPAADPFAGLPIAEMRGSSYASVAVRLGDRPWTEQGRTVTTPD